MGNFDGVAMMNNTESRANDRVNGVSTRHLHEVVEDFRLNPQSAGFQFRARNQWLDGGQTRSTVKNHYSGGREQRVRQRPFVLDSDLPGVGRGGNRAINPLEIQLAALAACFTTTLVYHAAARQVYLDAVDCVVEGEIDLRGFLGIHDLVPRGYSEIRMSVRIDASISVGQLDELVELAGRHSPILNMLRPGTSVTLRREPV
jgi:uncharacterized OsmC-like protein